MSFNSLIQTIDEVPPEDSAGLEERPGWMVTHIKRQPVLVNFWFKAAPEYFDKD